MKLFKTALLVTLVAGLGGVHPLSMAEDIDIYASTDTSTNKNPNILVIIDNSANWASAAQHWPNGIKQGESELNALRTVTGELGADVNVGLMLFTEGSSANNPDGPGGYLRYKIRTMDTTNKAALAELIGNTVGCSNGANSLNTTPNCLYKNFNDPAEKVGTAKTDYSAAMFEAYKYFGGFTNPANATTDIAGATTSTRSEYGPLRYSGAPDVKSDPAAYSADTAKSTYNPPISTANACAKNYIIFIGNGFPTQDSPSSLLSGVGGDTTQLDMPNFTTSTVNTLTTIATTACGTYAGATSALALAACNAAAPTDYPGYTTGTYSCAETSVCGAPTVVALGSTSTCGQYADTTACAAAAATAYPAYTGHYCTEVSSSCSYSGTNPDVPVDASTACMKLANQTACTNYGNTNYPQYSGFTCTDLGVNANGCTGGNSKFRIDATTKTLTGKTFQAYGTTTGATYGHTISANSAVVTVTPTGTSSAPTTVRYTDEWARFLNKTDVNSALGQQNVITYTVDVFKDQQDNNETALLLSMAKAGGGKYFAASNEDSIKNALRKIFAEVQSVNSVFASSSLPVSVQTQGTYLNQIFIGMFRPDAQTNPRWPGNLKQYKFKFFGNDLKMADKNGDAAVSATTGFITECADSIWTTDTGTYWDYLGSNANGTCTTQDSQFPLAGSTSISSDAPDGAVVEKGGAAQRLRGVSSSAGVLTSSSTNYIGRALKTCDPAASPTPCNALTDFNTTNVSAASLGVGTTALRDSLVAWVRGQDVDDENGNGITAEVRPSVHGDVLHSQPAVVDYGGSTGVIAYYGSNSGVFHAVDGGNTDTEGTELWGFIAPETYTKLNRLKTNSPLILFPPFSDPSATAKDYFFDGSIGVFQGKIGTVDKVWIYPAMRRGGRAIYAFDVTTPTSPSIKWRKGCFTNSTTADSSCSTGWSAIGQTWSKPQLGYISGYVDASTPPVPKPVLIFGGGYDTCEDTNSQTRCASTPRKGAGIWFVDADTGTILRIYPTNYSVPGDVSLIKDANGYVKYAYAGDTGGYVYRVNVGTSSTDGLTLTGWSNYSAATDIDIAYLSETNHARKFMYGPDVVEYSGFNAVLIGSGDREHILKTDYYCGFTTGTNAFSTVAGAYVTNQFYMIKDTPAAYPVTLPTASDLTTVAADGTTTVGSNGWKFSLNACEQTVNKALTIAGVVYFGTNQPFEGAVSSCAVNLGTARGYAVNFLTGARSTPVTFTGGGLPPSPVAGVVNVDGINTPFCIGCASSGPGDPCANNSALEGCKVTVEPPGTRSRIYWYRETD